MIDPRLIADAAEADVREGDPPFCRWCGRDWHLLVPFSRCPKAPPTALVYDEALGRHVQQGQGWHEQVRP